MHSELAGFVNTWMRLFGTATVLLSFDCVWLWISQMYHMRYISAFFVMFHWHMLLMLMLLIIIGCSSSAHITNVIANIHILKWSGFKSVFSVPFLTSVPSVEWFYLIGNICQINTVWYLSSKVLNIQVNIARIAERTQEDARCLCQSSH